MPTIDLITGGLGFLFTIMIFSYLLGDNPLFRIGTYIFIGAASGYVAAVAIWQVIYPRLAYPILHGSLLEKGLLIIPLLGMGALLMKASPRLTHLGTLPLAYLAGVGAAVTIGGAVVGTLFPQTSAAINAFDLSKYQGDAGLILEGIFNGSLILLGTITSLAYFHFGAQTKADGTVRRPLAIEWIAKVGGIFIAITLGVLFAGVLSASLTAFIERIASWSVLFSSF